MSLLLTLIWMHFVSDFIFQTDWMALNKSSSHKALLVHVLCYSAPFLFFGWKFAAITFTTHLITDFTTSRINKRLYALESKHWFFVCIGFDQAVHATTLLLTAQYLGLL